MEVQDGVEVAGREELVSSWQDLRGRNLLSGEHNWETIAGGHHAHVVALDSGVEGFSGLSCVKTDDHHAGGFLTVCKKGTTAGSPEKAQAQQVGDTACDSLPDSPKSTHEQVCFDDDEAELLPATKPMQFEGADCVHPSRPQEAVEAVPDLDEDNDAEHEASSLAGSDHEYAFIFEKPLSSLEVDSHMQDALETGSRRLSVSLEASRQAATPPTPMSTPQKTLPGALPPSPAPPAAELAGTPQDRRVEAPGADKIGTKVEDPAEEAPPTDAEKQEPVQMEEHAAHEAEPEQEKDAAKVEQAEIAVEATTKSIGAGGATAGTSSKELRGEQEVQLARDSKEPDVVTIDMAEARQRSLDQVGVIPGGRAAFGAPPPARPAAPGHACAGAMQPPRAADGHGAVPGGRAAFGAPVPAAGVTATSAPGWRPATAAQLPIGRALGGSPVQLLPQTAARRAAAADARLFPRLMMRRLDARAMPGGDMLDCFDRLWHGSSVVASQS